MDRGRLSWSDRVDYSGCLAVSANFMVAVFRSNDLEGFWQLVYVLAIRNVSEVKP